MKKILLLVCLLSATITQGQTVLGTNPASVKWMQINTPNFRVLFPEGFDLQAQRMANTFEHIRSVEAKSLGTEPRRISILLQNQSSVSNGFVSAMPRRSEFYAMPTQNYNFGGVNDWLNLLASHEYRHIVQYQHSMRGFTKAFYYLFGFPTASGLAHAAAPNWFWEGDAVATETAFTHGGRGRIPNFNLLMRTNLLEGRTFNYHKQYLQSYKHNIPDHYVLGYNMISYLRKKTGDPDIWGKISARSWNVPFIPFAFSNAIKNKADVYVTGLYKDMAVDLKKQWQAEIDALELTKYELITNRNTSAYTDYLYPQPQSDGSVLVQKQGIGNIEQYVLLDAGKEKKAFTPGFINESGMLSAPAGIVVWNEYGYDPRWTVRNYSQLKAYDLQRKKKVVVSEKHARLAGAAISPDGKQIVAIRTDQKYQHSIVFLSYPDGKIIREVANPQNDFYSMPRWSNTGDRVVLLKTNIAGRSVVTIDPSTGESKELISPSLENIGFPVLHENYLFINSPVSGIDNIHVIDLSSGKRFTVTTSKYGAYNPAVSADGSWIYYNDQGRDGMNVVRIPFNPASWREYTPNPNRIPDYQHLVEQEGRPTLFDSIPEQTYPVKKFSKASHLINPFSWGTFIQNDLATVDIGITSQDLLSTTSLGAGYRFDLNERTGMWRAGFSYQGFYPIIDFEYTQGERSIDEGTIETYTVNNSNQILSVATNDLVFKWKEQNVTAGVRVPLNFTNSKYSKGATVGNTFGYTSVSDFRNNLTEDRTFPAVIRDGDVIDSYEFPDYVGNGNLVYNYFSASAYRLLKQSKRDIRSRWGQALFVDYYNTPYGGDLYGQLFSATGYLFFPGLFKHHSINAHAAYQYSFLGHDEFGRSNDYLFRNTIPIPRGISVSRFETFISTSINYELPVWYPDIALGPVLNVQRVKLKLFNDYAIGRYAHTSGVDQNYHSVGGELMFDINIMRFQPQFDLGVRYSYGISHTFTNFELVIGTFNF